MHNSQTARQISESIRNTAGFPAASRTMAEVFGYVLDLERTVNSQTAAILELQSRLAALEQPKS
jgi:hypothetical protein